MFKSAKLNITFFLHKLNSLKPEHLFKPLVYLDLHSTCFTDSQTLRTHGHANKCIFCHALKLMYFQLYQVYTITVTVSLFRLEGKRKGSSTPAVSIHKPEVVATGDLLGEQNLGLQSNYRAQRYLFIPLFYVQDMREDKNRQMRQCGF